MAHIRSYISENYLVAAEWQSGDGTDEVWRFTITLVPADTAAALSDSQYVYERTFASATAEADVPAHLTLLSTDAASFQNHITHADSTRLF